MGIIIPYTGWKPPSSQDLNGEIFFSQMTPLQFFGPMTEMGFQVHFRTLRPPKTPGLHRLSDFHTRRVGQVGEPGVFWRNMFPVPGKTQKKNCCWFVLPEVFFLGHPRIYPLVNKHSNGKSQFLMGKSTISMAIFHSKMLVHQRAIEGRLVSGDFPGPC